MLMHPHTKIKDGNECLSLNYFMRGHELAYFLGDRHLGTCIESYQQIVTIYKLTIRLSTITDIQSALQPTQEQNFPDVCSLTFKLGHNRKPDQSLRTANFFKKCHLKDYNFNLSRVRRCSEIVSLVVL